MQAVLHQLVGPGVTLTPELQDRFQESPTCAPYLVSCFARPAVLYISPQFKRLTGYEPEQFKTGGAQFWFKLIHPTDMPNVVDRITKAEHGLITATAPPSQPLELEYRLKRADGTFLWLREFKWILTFRDGVKDHIVCALHDISAEKVQERADIQKLLQTKSATHGLLETALSYQSPARNNQSDSGPEVAPRISPRENEVLRLVAAGSSSKQIAAHLSISENTVETHRRNLLKKFKVNNSTALVQEAHRLAFI